MNYIILHSTLLTEPFGRSLRFPRGLFIFFLMNRLYIILLCALVLGGCYSDKGYEPKVDYTGSTPTYKVGGPNNLSTCNEKLEGTIVYIGEPLFSGIYACSDGVWTKIAKVNPYENKYDYLSEFDAKLERKSNALDDNDIPAPVFDWTVDKRNQRIYSIVKINGKWWFAENLDFETGKSKRYADKDCLDRCGVGYYYDDAVKACPSGFHLSTSREWEKLLEYVGGEDFAGIALKDDGGYWRGEARNTVGFSAMPIDIADNFYNDNCFWTARENYYFEIQGEQVLHGFGGSQRKCSVRCVEGY